MFENNNSEKCPLCQKKMKSKGSSLICEDCGYVLNKSREVSGGYSATQTEHNTSNLTENAPTKIPYNNTFEQKVAVDTYKPQSQSAKPVTNKKFVKGSMFVALFVIFMVAGFFVSFVGRINSTFDMGSDEYEKYVEVDNVEEIIDDFENNYNWDDYFADDIYNDVYNDWYNDDDDKPEYLIPESKLFIAFAEEVFGKECENITAEEYGSITYIYYDDYENLIKYAIDDGEVKEFWYDSSLYGYSEDLSCFTGLKCLDYHTGSFYEGELAGLTELEELHCNNSPAELAELLENPEKLVKLEMYDSYYNNSLEGIDTFSNLKSLIVDATYLEDLKGLDKLEHLEELVLENGSSIKNFTELGKLTTLKKFTISSYALKNLTIMENMTGLVELSITTTQISDISVLSNHKDTLKKLTLVSNSNVKDLSSLSEMTKLEEVSLECVYDGVLPDFSKMTGLKKLSLEGNGDMAKLSTAKSVEELTLEYCSVEDLSVLSNLTSLKSLSLGRMYDYMEDLHALMSLTKLEKLDLSSANVSGNIEEIFSLPNLRELSIEKAYIGLDCANITGNDKLEILNLSNARINVYKEPEDDDYYYFYNYDEVDMNAESAVFAKFPNLKELYLENMGLENVDFATGLVNLQKLDIANNNVSTLEPLSGLKNLEYVRCAQNTIGNDGGLGDKVIFE